MLQDEFKFYLEHQEALAKEYGENVIVIKGKKVIGVFDSEIEAVKETTPNHELGSFLVQKCSADPSSVIHTYRSRVRLLSEEVSL